MNGVKLIDTSVLCELLRIPGKSNAVSATVVHKAFASAVRNGTRFILPMATLVETGNHIAQNGDGRLRRAKAQQLSDFVRSSLDAMSPFLKPPFWDDTDVRIWVEAFPDSAMRGRGLGDLAIQFDLEKARKVLPSDLNVEIWSMDSHLKWTDRECQR